LEGAFGEFGDSVQGLAEEIQARQELLGAGEQEILSIIQEAVAVPEDESGDGRRERGSDAVSRLDFSDALSERIGELLAEVDLEDQESVESFVEQLSSFLIEQEPSALGLEGSFESLLGGASPSDLRDFIELFQQQFGGEGGEEGFTTSASISRTITEHQANQLLSFQRELVMLNRRQRSVLEDMLLEMGGTLPERIGSSSSSELQMSSLPGGQSAVPVTVEGAGSALADTMEVQINVTAEDTPERIAEKMDTAIRDHLRRRQR